MTIFLDLDGTIINSFSRHYLLLKEILIENGIDVDFNVDEYVQLKKDGYNNYKFLVNNLLVSEDSAKSIQNEWIKRIEDVEWLKYDTLYEDALDFINYVKDNKLIFLTARSNYNNLMYELEMLKIDNLVDEVFVVDTKEASLNKGSLLSKYIEDYANEDIIVIGDTEVDYNAAVSNNLKYFILNRGFRSKKFLSERNIESYNNFDEIKKVLNLKKGGN